MKVSKNYKNQLEREALVNYFPQIKPGEASICFNFKLAWIAQIFDGLI